MSGVVVNDVHSRLNETEVERVVEVDSVEAVRSALERARAAGLPVRAVHVAAALRRTLRLAAHPRALGAIPESCGSEDPAIH